MRYIKAHISNIKSGNGKTIVDGRILEGEYKDVIELDQDGEEMTVNKIVYDSVPTLIAYSFNRENVGKAEIVQEIKNLLEKYQEDNPKLTIIDEWK